MVRRLRSGITYANVMATIAVFLALGGGAYAAFKLPKNSVRSKNIVNGEVKTVDLGAGAVGLNQLGTVHHARGNSNVAAPGRNIVKLTAYPLQPASWTQQPGEVDLLTARADVSLPSSCTGPANSDPWGSISVGAIGSPVAFKGALNVSLPPLPGYRDTAALTAGLTGAPMALSAPATPTKQTLVARIQTNCEDSGQDITVHSMSVDIVRLR